MGTQPPTLWTIGHSTRTLDDFLGLLVRHKITAVRCSEAVWWRCHRALSADCLKAAGYRVCHILDARKTEEHPYTSAARIENGKLSYVPATRGRSCAAKEFA